MRKCLAPCLAVLSATALASAPVSTPSKDGGYCAGGDAAQCVRKDVVSWLDRMEVRSRYTARRHGGEQYQVTKDLRYLEYLRATVDPLPTSEGEVKEFKPEAHSLDNPEMGRAALFLYGETHASDTWRQHRRCAMRDPKTGLPFHGMEGEQADGLEQ